MDHVGSLLLSEESLKKQGAGSSGEAMTMRRRSTKRGLDERDIKKVQVMKDQNRTLGGWGEL